MSLLSLGFVCLLGIETAALVVLILCSGDDNESIIRFRHIFNVLSVSCVINCCYLVVWFLQMQAQEVLK